MIHIAIFASGSGTNAENLIKYFNGDASCGHPASTLAKVDLVVSNKPDAYVLQRAARLKVKYILLDKEQLCTGQNPDILKVLAHERINFIILAGYLLQVPSVLIKQYPDRILNIHPALLPKFGGKGMYGERVHKAVLAAGEKESGITVHLVDEQMDHGKILFQAKCIIEPGETLESLEAKIHLLEQANFPHAAEEYFKTLQ